MVPIATVEGETEEGVAFVDSWILGVLSVEDLGRITVTAEVVGEVSAEAGRIGLLVGVAPGG